MFLTPPDAISQTLLAIPIYVLYESGLLLARVLLADRLKEEAGDAETGEDAANQ
jgi:sec-independent protein translocase protein TatC